MNKDLDIIGRFPKIFEMKRGNEEIEVRVSTRKLTKSEFEDYLLTSNLPTGEWDEEQLKESFDAEFLEYVGFDMDYIEKLFPEQPTEGNIGDDEVPEVDEKDVFIKTGGLYQLGNHRLLCGDATKREDVDRLTNGEKADMVFTDPPYGINIVSHGKVGYTGPLCFGKGKKGQIVGKGLGVVKAGTYREIEGDDQTFNPEHLLDLAPLQILFGANHYSNHLPRSSHWLVWDKKVEDGSADRTFFSDAELLWTNVNKKTCLIYRYQWSGVIREGNRELELNERVHPTQKPAGLLIAMINDYSKEKQIIIDSYGGSGSTLIACEKTNRICYMMEIDPYYCQVIIERWEKFTEGKAVKL